MMQFAVIDVYIKKRILSISTKLQYFIISPTPRSITINHRFIVTNSK